MIKTLLLILSLTMSSTLSWGQIRIKGTVTDQKNTPIPGVMVKVKGTVNSTTTDFDGLYKLTVNDTTAVLSFSYIGFVDQELPTNGLTTLDIVMKEFVIYEAWDQKIGIYLLSGLINNPVGGQFDFSLPVFGGSVGLKTSIGYQANFKENQFLKVNTGLHHVRINDKGYGADFDFYYSRALLGNGFDLKAYAVETTWPIYNFNLKIGYSHIDLKRNEFTDHISNSGIELGAQTWISNPLNLLVSGRVGFYKNLIDFQTEVRKSFGQKINAFVKYRNVSAFSELSVGIGLELTYYFKYQRN
ncbi:hypothetical protein GTQ34_16275 [Muricauda sp. JGD-17]|uniref:Carboxypeptidase-like regulatory domain-containing protein n=1 Tax=Flagellimonas ochracea TaxID=2696472 RepID=A0A964TEJ8_9FLAO|nr:carboxypeptidase-like regulatory domain-containing protein [Allomuricauda ochracea]NAY93469.1 hypothetical protein [Allomuricauda ochracea]